MESETFRNLMSNWATGVSVVTSVGPRGPHGMTANAFLSVSLEPPLVLVSIGADNDSLAIIRETGRFAVNILAHEQEHLSVLFAIRRERGEEAFVGVDWSPSPNGLPWLKGAVAQLDCSVQAAIPAQDHTLFLGRVEVLQEAAPLEAPLVYFRSGYTTTRDV